MAANIEYQVLSMTIDRQDFHSLERLRIDGDYFYSPECKTIYQYLWEHFHKTETFGSVPSWQIINTIFPSFPNTPSADTIDTLCEQLRLAKMRLELLAVADKVQAHADFNPREGMEFLRESAAQMSSKHEMTNDMELHDAYDTFMQDYQMVASGKGVTGLPWPWAPLNEATQGIHKGEFIPLYGRPKNMKTWAALYIATVLNVHANSRVLVYSLEMKPKQIIRRVAAIRAAINYRSLLAGKLQPADYYRFFEQLKILQVENQESKDTGTAVRNARFKVTQGSGGAGVSFLQSKIREFRPDFVLVDSFHLMKDDRQKKRSMDWKNVAHVSQDLKGTARDFDVPLMGTCQANRKADKNPRNADLEEIAYADAIGQDADFTIRVQKRKDKDTKEPELVLAFPGSREADIDGFVIHGIPALNFSLKSMNIGSPDDDDSDDGNKSSGKKKKGDGSPPTIPSARLRGI